MKKLIIVLNLISLPFLSIAQKARVQDASNFMKYEEWDKAKEAIDEAAKNETSKAMEKMWYYRGKIYLILHEHPKFGNLCEGTCLDVAYESFKKSLELNSKSEWADEINYVYLKNIPITYFTQGSKNYEAKNYEAALKNWELAAKTSTDDSGEVYRLSVTYSAFAAEKAGNKIKAAEYYQKTIDKKLADDNTYSSYANLYSSEKKYEEALKVLELGRAQYPDSLSLIYGQINLYLLTNKTKEATDALNAATAKDPKNQSLYMAMGSAFDNMANPKDADGKDLPKPLNYSELIIKAVDSYKKGLAINADNYEMNYNLGALIFNEAAEIANGANKITDNNKYAKEKERADAKFKESQPYLERAMEINPKKTVEDEALYKGTLQSLKQLYARIGENEKYERIKLMLDGK